MSLLDFNEKEIVKYFENIRRVVENILNGKGVSALDWQHVFPDIYQIVIWKVDDGKSILVDFLFGEIVDYVRNIHAQILRESEDFVFLKVYLKCWNEFCNKVDLFVLLFKQTDAHCFDNSSPEERIPLEHRLMCIWMEHIYHPLRDRLLGYTIQLIHDDRNGLVIDSSLVVGVKHSCMRLQGNTHELEDAYVNGLKNYYPPLIEQHISQKGFRSYMLYSLDKTGQEEANALRYLDSDTVPEVMKSAVNVLVESQLALLTSEFATLLVEKNYELLRVVYALVLKTSRGVEHILPAYEAYMRNYGLGVIRDNAENISKDFVLYVSSLINIFGELSHLSSAVFDNNASILTSKDKAFREVVNNTEVFTLEMPASRAGGARRAESRCPELLALYCDQLLRKSPSKRHLTESKIDASFHDVFLVLKYLLSKDIFIRHYKSNLMRRILSGNSADIDMEETTVGRLRVFGMPADQVNHLQQMLQDHKLSKDMTIEFRNYCRQQAGRPGQPVENPDTFSLCVLTSSAWSLQSETKADISLPTECQDALTLMGEFYRQKHHGRNLIWQHYLSHGILVYTSDVGRFEFELTAHQIVVLYAWYRRPNDALHLEDLSTATGLGEADMNRALLSLCQHPKMKSQLLLYSPKSTQKTGFTADTEFRLNLQFGFCKNEKSVKRRFNIIGRLALSHGTGNDDEIKDIGELRRMRTTEGIIKLMKTRKQMHLNDIYSGLVDLLLHHFMPTKFYVKEALEWLIENKYIRRADTDMNMYEYLA